MAKKIIYVDANKSIMPIFNVKCFACGNQFDYDSDKNATPVKFFKDVVSYTIYLIPCPMCGETNELKYRDGSRSG